LCTYCKTVRQDISFEHLNQLGLNPIGDQETRLYQANSCSFCKNGYRGRVALFEVMPISATLSQFILQRETPLRLHHQAQLDGMKTLFEVGLEKVKQGITTIEEIQRVTTRDYA
jgi:type IV pilus assembly protein PilB